MVSNSMKANKVAEQWKKQEQRVVYDAAVVNDIWKKSKIKLGSGCNNKSKGRQRK